MVSRERPLQKGLPQNLIMIQSGAAKTVPRNLGPDSFPRWRARSDRAPVASGLPDKQTSSRFRRRLGPLARFALGGAGISETTLKIGTLGAVHLDLYRWIVACRVRPSRCNHMTLQPGTKLELAWTQFAQVQRCGIGPRSKEDRSTSPVQDYGADKGLH